MAGFRIETEISKDGRVVATATATLVDREGRVCATATSTHMTVRDLGSVPTAEVDSPVLADAIPGEFFVKKLGHDLPVFGHAVEIAYPPGETGSPGPTTIWMRTLPLLDDETPSAFQMLCPLADCGNAISRNAELSEVTFINADITIVCFRPPGSDWLASRSLSHWDSSGVGLSTALLFDDAGPVAEVFQTLMLARPG